MSRTRNLVISGATVIALAGATAAVAFVANYTTSGSQTVTPGTAGTAVAADVELSVTNEAAVTDLLTKGTATFTVQAKSNYGATIVAADLQPDVLVPVGCPTAGFAFSPAPVLANGSLKAGETQEVGTFSMTFNSNLAEAQDSCFQGPFAFSFGPGNGLLLPGKSAPFVLSTFICKAVKDGVPTNFTGMGSFAAGDYIVRVRNESFLEADYTLAVGGTSLGVTGSVKAGESDFVALKTPAAGFMATTMPANTSVRTGGTNETSPCTYKP